MSRHIAVTLALMGAAVCMACYLVNATRLQPVLAQAVSPLPTPLSTRASTPLSTPLSTQLSTPLSTSTPTPWPTPPPFTGTLVLSNSVSAIGDSVMLGAMRELSKTIIRIDINATKSRQMKDAVKILSTRQLSNTLSDIVIVHIGNNGPIDAKLFDQLMMPLRDVKAVLVVNLKVGRNWEAANNTVLADGVKRYANATLVNWHDLISSRASFLAPDGTHMGAKSARLYVDMIVDALTQIKLPDITDHVQPKTVPATTPEGGPGWPDSRRPR